MTDDKKKKPVRIHDTLAKNLSIFGAVITLPLLVPFVPWRITQVDANLGGRFSVSRQFHPLWATNGMSQGVLWIKLKKEMCSEVQRMNTPNPIGIIISVATHATETGGTIGGCFTWQACKDHAAARCWQYGQFAIIGFLVCFFEVVSFICSCCVPLCMSKEAQCKKKKMKQDAMQQTQICAIVAFVTAFFAAMLWIGITEFGFRNLKKSGYYPWPTLFIGAYLAIFGFLIQFVAMIFAIQRCKPEEKKEEGEEEEKEEYVGNAGGMPYGPGGMPYDPAMGPPPPYDPMMGPPPMMVGGPGMGPPPPMGMGPPMGPPMGPGGPPPY